MLWRWLFEIHCSLESLTAAQTRSKTEARSIGVRSARNVCGCARPLPIMYERLIAVTFSPNRLAVESIVLR
jgi:hypothetical protein